MYVELNSGKQYIVIDDRLIELSNSLEKNLEEVESKPKNVKYLAEIEQLPTGDARIVWGWSEPNTIHTDTYLLNDLKDINYDNNLDSLIDYDQGVIAPVVFVFSCIECIRRKYDKPIYFVTTTDVTAKIFI